MTGLTRYDGNTANDWLYNKILLSAINKRLETQLRSASLDSSYGSLIGSKSAFLTPKSLFPESDDRQVGGVAKR